MAFTKVYAAGGLRLRHDKPKLVPVTSIVELSPSELSPSELFFHELLPSKPSPGKLSRDEPITNSGTVDIHKYHDVVQEGQGWEIRELTSNEDKDPLYIAQWKVRLIKLCGLSAVIDTSISFHIADVVYRALCRVAEEEPPGLELALTKLACLAGFASLVASVLLTAAYVYALWGQSVKTLRLVGDDLPSVDIVIPCCNEPLDVLQDTILGTLAIDYPSHRYRLVVTDDGASANLRDWVASLQCDRLYYTARVKPTSPDFKAGNLNHAIEFMARLSGGPAPYIASLDADMIPEKRWLRAVLPHMLLDPKMGVACPSQSFYHAPPNDVLCQNGRDTWNVDGVSRHLVNCAINSGSGFVVRREAVLDIGGFPTSSLTEDVLSSTLMLTKGWHVSHISEALQYGLVPGSYWGSVKQFTRWHIGGVQVLVHFKAFLSKRLCGALTWQQRMCALSVIANVGVLPFLETATMVILPLHTLFVGAPIIFRDLQTSKAIIRLCCSSAIWGWFCDHKRTLISSYRALNRAKLLATYMAPYNAVAFMQSFLLPSRIGGARPRFLASGSIANALHERDPAKRAPLSIRARVMLFDQGVIFHVGIVAINVLALLYSAYRVYLEAAPETFYAEFLRSVAWTIPSAAHTVLSCSIPIQYMLAPPDVAHRDESMGTRDKAGARYPDKRIAEKYISRWHFGLSEACDMVVVCHVLLFVATYTV